MGVILAKDTCRGDLYEPASQNRYAENAPVNYNDSRGDKKASKNPKKRGQGKEGSSVVISPDLKSVTKTVKNVVVPTAVKQVDIAYRAAGVALKANDTLKAMAQKLKIGTDGKKLIYISVPIDVTHLIRFAAASWLRTTHYNRNLLNDGLLRTKMQLEKSGYIQLSAENSRLHQFSSPDNTNKKYVLPNGYKEMVYDKDGNIVLDPRDVGTYNVLF